MLSTDIKLLKNDIENMLNVINRDENDAQYDNLNLTDDPVTVDNIQPIEYIPLHINVKLHNDIQTSICNILTGNTRTSRQTYENSIQTYLSMMPADTEALFAPLSLTTLTIYGKLSRVQFHEEEIVDMLDLSRADNRILKIECNYGEYYHPHPFVKLFEKKRSTQLKTSRGHKRRFQGSGLFFGSQITFYIHNDDYEKTYIIKLFRRGEIQVSGIRTPSTRDVIKPLILLRNYLRDEFDDKQIELLEIRPVMRNYTSKLQNEELRFDLNALEECILMEKTDAKEKKSSLPPIGISTIQYNTERYFAVVIKFDRSVPWKLEKKSAIKILKSGKVNFDGSNSSLECLELYCWFNMFCLKHQKKIIFNCVTANQSMSDSDAEKASGYASIYDSE